MTGAVVVDAHASASVLAGGNYIAAEFAEKVVIRFRDAFLADPVKPDFKAMFAKVESEIERVHITTRYDILGATAMFIHLTDAGIHGAHVGDCRLISMSRGGSPVLHNTVHRVTDPAEAARLAPHLARARVLGSKQFSIRGQPPREYLMIEAGASRHGLEVTRSLGDTIMEPALIHEPDEFFVSFEGLDLANTIFALVSDGGEEPALEAMKSMKTWGQYHARLTEAEDMANKYVRQMSLYDLTILFFAF